MQRVRIGEVAARAGVSTATVSRALSGRGPVSDGVAARVRAAAAELGYRVDPTGRALRSQRTDTVGMVVPSISNPFFTALVESVEHVLGQGGRELFLCDARSDPAIEARRVRALTDRHVDGIVISPCHGRDSVDAVRRAAAALPVVQLDRFVEGTGTDWVGVDDRAALGLVLEHLHARGVGSVAFVGAGTTHSSTEQRLDGFTRHAHRLGLRIVRDGVALEDYSLDWGTRAAADLLSSPDPPGGIVCADDLIALGALRACRTLGARVPEDVLVTGFDDIEFARHADPPLTTVVQPHAAIAQEAVRLLFEQTADGERDATSGERQAVRIALTPRLAVRGSTGDRDPG